MTYNNDSVNRVRNELQQYMGCKVKLKANRGRKRMLEANGVLENMYPNVFTIRIDKANEMNQRISYSYTDLLTANVKLDFFKADKLL
jgi:uncharacterized protein Veg